MTSSPLQDPDKIAFAGDWHGDGNYAVRQIERLASDGVQVVIHAGDLMYDFEQRFILRMHTALENANILIL